MVAAMEATAALVSKLKSRFLALREMKNLAC